MKWFIGEDEGNGYRASARSYRQSKLFALPISNVSKLFSLKCYPIDNDDIMTKERSMTNWKSEVDSALCKVQLLEFLKNLKHECENKEVFFSKSVF